jgi:hypothetical protein
MFRAKPGLCIRIKIHCITDEYRLCRLYCQGLTLTMKITKLVSKESLQFFDFHSSNYVMLTVPSASHNYG